MALSRNEGARCEGDSSLEDGGVTWRKGEPIGAGGIAQQQRGRQEGRGEERQEGRGGGTLKGWGGVMMTAMVMGPAIAGNGRVCNRERQSGQAGAAEIGQPNRPAHLISLPVWGLLPSKDSMATPLRENAQSRDGQRQTSKSDPRKPSTSPPLQSCYLNLFFSCVRPDVATARPALSIQSASGV